MQENKEGTIFIVDISGYARFVSITDNEGGALVISELLEAIINANVLSFNISKIEGDAILFYKHGSIDAISEILRQFDMMLNAFNKRVASFEKYYPQAADLTIKLVVHYGEIRRFSIGCYLKLFGQSVIEAHRLLKNSINSSTYALVTNTFLQQQSYTTSTYELGYACEIYDLANLCYTYFDFNNRQNQNALYDDSKNLNKQLITPAIPLLKNKSQSIPANPSSQYGNYR